MGNALQYYDCNVFANITTDSPAAFTYPFLSVELIAVNANLRVGYGGIRPSFRDGNHIGFIRCSPIPELNKMRWTTEGTNLQVDDLEL